MNFTNFLELEKAKQANNLADIGAQVSGKTAGSARALSNLPCRLQVGRTLE